MLKIDIQQLQNNLVLIALEGPLDNTTISAFEQSIEPLLKGKQGLTLILDLSRLNYINSTGIARFLQYYLHLKSSNGRLRIFGVPDFIGEILDICGASKILDIYTTREEALPG